MRIMKLLTAVMEVDCSDKEDENIYLQSIF